MKKLLYFLVSTFVFAYEPNLCTDPYGLPTVTGTTQWSSFIYNTSCTSIGFSDGRLDTQTNIKTRYPTFEVETYTASYETFRTYSDATGTHCERLYFYDDVFCDAGTPPPTCPPHSTYDPSSESCKCTLPYVPSYDLNGTLTCILTDCPPIYENHNPPLPLFLQTDSPTKCNFFPMADAAVLDLDGKICCYGQEWDQEDPQCATNEIELAGQCYPIDNQDSNSSDPTDCQPGTHWDNYDQQCVLDDDPWRDANGTSGIDADNPDNNGTTPGALPTQGDMDAFEEAMDLDGVSDELGKLINSYVLVQLPVNVGGQCSNEMVKTFTILGKSYTLDLREYMSMMDEYLPIIKMLVMFLFAVTGVVIVLSGRSD